MSNHAALESLLRWWRSVPSFRRPGHHGNFDLAEHESERFIFELREAWSRCGVAILKLCETHREWHVRSARVAVQELLAWVNAVEALAGLSPKDKQVGADLLQWAAKWRRELARVSEDPLGRAPGGTLGCGASSYVLNGFHRLGDGGECVPGPGGPLSELPESVQAIVKDENNKTPFAREMRAQRDAFPESIHELHHDICQSPWTAAHVLNWLLSDKGILRVTARSPRFAGLAAVPYAREWLDQLRPAFDDWRISRFEARGPVKVPEDWDGKHRTQQRVVQRDPACDAAYHQIYQPIVPADYVVPVGTAPVAMDGQAKPRGLSQANGQCVVFEFLLSRLQQLQVMEYGQEEELAAPPMVRIVDGRGRRNFAVQVGNARESKAITTGGARLLFDLGESGLAENVLASRVTAIRESAPAITSFLIMGKKRKNYYVTCHAPKLRGQVLWRASAAPPRRS